MLLILCTEWIQRWKAVALADYHGGCAPSISEDKKNPEKWRMKENDL